MDNSNKLLIVDKGEIRTKIISEISSEEIGQKALGLCHVPKAWTLPFFVIDKQLYLEFCRSNDECVESLVKNYLCNINKAITELDLGEKLIIRSSGQKEGMEERGKYESILTTKDDLVKNLIILLTDIKKCKELSDVGMPLLVQKYISHNIIGHVSNERRFSKENRDFVYEYQSNNSNEDNGRISLRNWRIKYNTNEFKKKELKYSINCIEMLKIVCAYFYYSKLRVHLEFICCNNVLYIVQRDEEFENRDSIDPSKYDVRMFANEAVFNPKILRKIQPSDKGKYRKIDNVFIYQEVGIQLPPLYILEHKDHIRNLEYGKIHDNLKQDLEFLTKQSLVIRTNIVSDDRLKSQLSKRSNEIRTCNAAIDFLINTSKELKKCGIENYIYIFHNFIPAKIAAFVNAKPLERIVEIQALWGLPEGLYYNAHDRIIVDTACIDISNMNKKNFVIVKNDVYKESFIAPDDVGRWVVKKMKIPYDWKTTIQNDEVIQEIAYNARLIAEKVGKELSIMWFVEIDKNFYGVDNIPWYHEEYDRNNYYYSNSTNASRAYKKKYFNQEEFVIEDSEDIEYLRKLSSEKIGIVRLKPREDELLRSKDFINDIGTICNEKGINIFLEGAVLAHSYYQLINTGATVLLAHEIKQYDEKIEYNKLVRDKIPEIISQNGENVKYVSIKGIGLVQALKYKLLEEAYEVLGAEKRESVLEELADLLEVCEAMYKNSELVKEDRKNECKFYNSKGCIYKLEFECLVLEDVKQYYSINKGLFKYATLKRNSSNFQLDLFFDKNVNEVCFTSNPIFCSQHGSYKSEILKNAFTMLTVQGEECLNVLECIRENCKKLCNKYDSEDKALLDIRNKKRDKRGGFEKGYVLQKTSMLQQEESILQGFDEYSIEPVDIYDLQINSKIDVEILDLKRLLIRITFPIYFQNSIIVTSKKIEEFLGVNHKIIINMSFIETKIICAIDIIKEDYKQLEFDNNLNIV